jgi:hypothetical protein
MALITAYVSPALCQLITFKLEEEIRTEEFQNRISSFCTYSEWRAPT